MRKIWKWRWFTLKTVIEKYGSIITDYPEFGENSILEGFEILWGGQIIAIVSIVFSIIELLLPEWSEVIILLQIPLALGTLVLGCFAVASIKDVDQRERVGNVLYYAGFAVLIAVVIITVNKIITEVLESTG